MNEIERRFSFIFNVAFVLLVVTIFASCSTVEKINSYSKDDKEAVGYQVVIKSIDVEVDFIQKDDIESQIKKNLMTKFLEMQQSFDNNRTYSELPKEEIYIELVVSQQSFMKNMESYNSIFASSIVTDKNGEKLSFDCLNKETKSTLISSVEQNRVCDFVYEKVFDVLDVNFQKCVEIEKELEKEQKKNKKDKK